MDTVYTMPTSLRSRREELRQDYLEEYLDEIRSVFTGRCTPLEQFITDENGKASDEKIEALAAEIADDYLIRRREINYEMFGDSGSPSEAENDYHNRELEMYHCFFYFASQGIIEVCDDIFRTVKTFDNIRELVSITPANNTIEDELDLCWSDFKDFNPGYGFIEANKLAYSMITKKHVAATYPPDRTSVCKEHFKGSSIPGKLDNLQEEVDSRLNTEYISKDVPKWIETLANPEKYADCYIRFREQYVYFRNSGKLPGSHFYFTVTDMVDYFLQRHKLSVFSSTEETAIAFDRIERFINSIRKG